MKQSLLPLLFLWVCATAASQPNVIINYTTLDWPQVSVNITPTCAGQIVSPVPRQDLRLYEDGRRIDGYTLDCIPPGLSCPPSVAIVLEASGFMAGAPNAAAKACARSIVDRMDGVVDEAAILWFAADVTTAQQMTAIKPMLYSTVDALPASGSGVALFDGVYQGIQEAARNSVNSCRAVIVIAHGADLSSTHGLDDVLDLAKSSGVVLHTVGQGGTVDSTFLKRMASETGGSYMHEPGGEACGALLDLVKLTAGHCTVGHRLSCRDGIPRVLRVEYDGPCGGTAFAEDTVAVPSDGGESIELRLELPDVDDPTGGDIIVPLMLSEHTGDIPWYPFTLHVGCDTSVVERVDVRNGLNTLMFGKSLAWSPSPGGMRIRSDGILTFNTTGVLFELVFRMRDNGVRGVSPLPITDLAFDRGCFTPVLRQGSVSNYTRVAVLRCEMSSPPALAWDSTSASYTPGVFPVSARLHNVGERMAPGALLQLDFDTSRFMLVSGDRKQPVNGRDLEAGDSLQATWSMTARPQWLAGSSAIQVLGSAQGADASSCSQEVHFPVAGPILSCRIESELITVDSLTREYSPMPFFTTVYVTNDGGPAEGNLFAEIVLEDQLELAGPDAPDHYVKMVNPPRLQHGQTGVVRWILLHPPSPVPVSRRIWTSTQGEGVYAEQCMGSVALPGLDTSTVGIGDVPRRASAPGGFALSVYPAPNDGLVSVHVEKDGIHDLCLSVFDLLGREVYAADGIAFENSRTVPVDLNNLPAGSYVVLVSVDGLASARMIVKR